MNNIGINSEVENNKHLVKAGMELVYMDGDNFIRYNVNEVDEYGFEAIEIETGNIDWYNFDELQYGWIFKDRSILNN